MNGKCEGFKLSKLIGEYVDATNAEVAIDDEHQDALPRLRRLRSRRDLRIQGRRLHALRIGRDYDNPTSANELNDVQAKSAVTMVYDLGEGFCSLRGGRRWRHRAQLALRRRRQRRRMRAPAAAAETAVAAAADAVAAAAVAAAAVAVAAAAVGSRR